MPGIGAEAPPTESLERQESLIEEFSSQSQPVVTLKKDGSQIEQFTSSEDERGQWDTPVKKRQRDTIRRALQAEMLKGKKARALKARDFKKDLKKTTKPPTVKGKPGVKAEELAKSPPRRLPSTATEEDHRKSNITLMPSLKCGLRLSPPKPEFHKRTQEPEKKKPVEMSEREIRRRYSALYRKGGIAEFQQVRVRDGKIECHRGKTSDK